MADDRLERAGDPQVQFAELKGALESQIQKTFPIRDRSGKFEVRLRDVKTDDRLGTEDIKEQHRRRLEGKSWSAPVTGVVDVVDVDSGKVLVSRRQRITEIPKMTRHYSWIIGGQEMTLQNQWRLRPGAYVKATERDGEYEAQFQLAKGKSFDLQQEKEGNLFMKVGGRKIPLVSVLRAQGVSDDQMRAAWGEDAFARTAKKAKDKDLASLYEAWKKQTPPAGSDHKALVNELFRGTLVDPEITKQNLGVHSPQVNGHMLLAASKKLIDVSAQRTAPDPIDSLQYKELWTAKDFMVERLQRSTMDITQKVQSAFRKPTVVRRIQEGDPTALRDVVTPDLLRKPMFYPFTSTSLASVSKQTNPIAMLADKSATTIMGPGGIKSHFMLNQANTAIDPSHLGYLDPVFTPESAPGTTTHLAYGVVPTRDRKPVQRLYNVKTGRYEEVDAATASSRVVALPDQVVWKNGKPSPRVARFRTIDGKGELRDDLKWGDVHYVMPQAAQVFATETNLVPFMSNDNAGRTTMSARHMAQAISIVGREPPAVQVAHPSGKTFEQVIGSNFLAHKAPVAGKVARVTANEVTIQDDKGKTHQVHLYNHYPTNDKKGMLHSAPLVKVGDRVKPDQVIADNNYTRAGALALGTNLRVAYLANGFNHEDGIVISESAAKKLASEHLYKPDLYATDQTTIDKKAFLDRKPGTYTPERLSKIDDSGTVKVGSRVKPGDPLILAVEKAQTQKGITADTVARLGKKLRNPWSNKTVTWDAPYEGEVVAVHTHGKTTTVHVKTLEPAQVGSKLSTRHSAKGIIAAVMPDAEMPVNEHGKPTEMLINPLSVPGRQNPGQIMETVAGRISEKTGKPYVVTNFQGGVDYLAKLKGELKKHGLKDTDTLYDPKTGRRLGEVTTGPHYVFQLEHQIDKKTHVRSGGPSLKQFEAPVIRYEQDIKIPRGGGPTGAQSLGSLGIGAALASGLHDNLREMQTLKCFLWSTPVITDQGVMQIGKIVNGRLPVKVLSWNPIEKCLSFKRILNYWKRDLDEPLVEVKVHGSLDFGRYKTRMIRCTEGHRFYTADGRKVFAKDLAGEEVLTPALRPSPTQRDVLVGSLLGDGCLQVHNGVFPYFMERHGVVQREYLEYKASLLAEFSARAVRQYVPRAVGFSKGDPMVDWSTLAQPEFRELHQIFYGGTKGGRKRIPENLRELLSPLSVAIWYQDDGSLVQGTRQRILRLHIGNVTEDDAKRAAAALNDLVGVTFRPALIKAMYDGREATQWNLRLGTWEEIDAFLDYVRPHVHPTLAYKVDGMQCGEDLPRPEDVRAHKTVSSVKVLSVRPTVAPAWEGQFLYNLEVDVNHNYFVHGILVGNSDQPQANEAWAALMYGDRLPPPKVPFAYKKFEALLQGMGVNLEKTATSVRIIPRTDAETRQLSRGAITRPTRGIRGKDDAPEKGGIFDPTITGGNGPGGQHWGHIELVEAVPHPVYAAPIAKALGIKEADIPEILAGKQKLNGQVGPKAFTSALKKLDVDAEMRRLSKQLADPKVKETALNHANQQFKALRLLKETGKKPIDAWMIRAVPVIPPIFRPMVTADDGSVRSSPLNALYRRVGMVNESLQSSSKAGVPWDSTLDARAGLYGELGNLFGTVPKGKKALDLDVRGTKENKDKRLPGIIHMIAGENPKDGFFQSKLLSKKQDYTARATIVADPNLSVDELGVPKKLAVELMRPMVVARLMRGGKSNEQAQLMVSRHDPLAYAALAEEVKHRPVIMKRDPVLHQYGLVGQNIKLIDSEAIKVSPLVLPPVGGDIDGDTVSLFVPLHPSAIEEVRRITPSQRTLSDASGDVLYTPTNEGALSLYRASLARKKSDQVFASRAEAEAAFLKNKIDLDHRVHLKGVGDTTLGRMRIAEVVPERYKKDLLTNLDKPFDRKYQSALLKEVALNQPKHFVGVVDGMSRLGFKMAYDSGHSVTLSDLTPLTKERDAIVRAAQKKVDVLNRKGKGEETKQVWLDATQKLHDVYRAQHKVAPTNVSDMAYSGIKAKPEQFQGLVMAPMLIEDHRGDPSKVPVTKSFSEGIDIGGYFVQASGARRGVIQKVNAVREPGYMSKLLVRANIDQPITATDCGTAKGIALEVGNKDIVDRHLAAPHKLGGADYRAGTVVTPEMLARAKKDGTNQLIVRSPLKCRQPQGVCSVCMGLHPSGKHWEIGEHAGLIASQSLGERAAQLMLRQTHGGGIVSLNPHTVADFEDVQNLFNAKKPGIEDAAVAMKDGKVTKVERMPQGTYAIHVDGKPQYTRKAPLPETRVGADVKRGQKLSLGHENVHDVLKTRGHDAAQHYMTDRIGTIYAREGVMRRHTELAVRNSMGMVRIVDPGSHHQVLRDDHMMKSAIDELNRAAPTKAPIRYEPVIKPIESVPLKRQTDFMARLGAENLAKTMLQAAQHGETAHFDSLHPLPALAHGATYNLLARKARHGA